MGDWKAQLAAGIKVKDDLLAQMDLRAKEAEEFLSSVVMPALLDIQVELKTHNRRLTATKVSGELVCGAVVTRANEEEAEFEYLITVKVTPTEATPQSSFQFINVLGKKAAHAGQLSRRDQPLPISLVKRDAVIHDFIRCYDIALRELRTHP